MFLHMGARDLLLPMHLQIKGYSQQIAGCQSPIPWLCDHCYCYGRLLAPSTWQESVQTASLFSTL